MKQSMNEMNQSVPSEKLTLMMLFSITLMAVLGVASITPAFPKIAAHFKISGKDTALLITVFTFPGIILTPVLGVLADRYGRKRILVPSLLLFGSAGFSCTFATQFHTLLILRFIQGTGAAALGSLNVTLIGDMFNGPKRAHIMGINASVLSIGTASYPFLGGSLAMLGWNVPFVLPLIAVPIAIGILLWLHNPEPQQKGSLWEYMKLTYLAVRNRQILLLFFISLITFILLYGVILSYLPFLMKERFSSSAFIIGLFMSTMSLSTAVTSFQTGKIIRYLSAGRMITLAFILYGLALVFIPFSYTLGFLLIPMLLFGMAQGLNIPSVQTLLAGSTKLEQRGIVMSLNGTVLRLGQTIGPFGMGLVYVSGSLSGVFITGAALAVVTSLFIIILFRNQ